MNIGDIEGIWSAIKDIDRIKSSTVKEELLDDVWQCIISIDKKEFDSYNTDIIINGIRSALVKLYIEKLNAINSDIGVDAKDLENARLELPPNNIS